MNQKANDVLKERRKARFENNESLDTSVLDEDYEITNLAEIIPFLQSEDPNIILSSLKKISSLIKENDDMNFLFDFVYQLIDYLNTFAEIADKFVDENELVNEKNKEISELSMAILNQIFSINIQENSSIKEPFFVYYIETLSETDQMATFFSVISKMIYSYLSYKNLFFESKCYNFFIQIPILQIPFEYIEPLVSIISICIRQDGDLDLPLEVPTQLLRQLIIILENYENFESKIIDLCAQGCYNYVSIGNIAISLFILSDVHLKLLNSTSNMTDIGICYSISSLGKCFCTNQNEIISYKLLNILNTSGNEQVEEEEEEKEFNIEMKVVEEIPIEIFKNGLELQDESARADVAIALCNVMVKVNLIIDEIFQCGLFNSLMEHLKFDNFNIRVTILKVFVQIFKSVSSDCLHLFIDDQLFQIIEELVESDLPEIEEIAYEIFILVKFDEQHEEIIDEFCEFLDSRTL